MDSNHLYQSFRLLIGLVTLTILIAAGLAVIGKLNDALVVILNGAVMGCFTLLRGPTSKNVTVDNAANDPIPVEGTK